MIFKNNNFRYSPGLVVLIAIILAVAIGLISAVRLKRYVNKVFYLEFEIQVAVSLFHSLSLALTGQRS